MHFRLRMTVGLLRFKVNTTRARERERERNRQTDRQIDTQTDRHTERESEREKQRATIAKDNRNQYINFHFEMK